MTRPHLVIDPAVAFGAPIIASTGTPVDAVAALYAAGETAEAVQADYGLTRHELLLALWHMGVQDEHGWGRWASEIAGPALWSARDLDPDAVPLPERDGWHCPTCDETYEEGCSAHGRDDWVKALAVQPKVDILHPDGHHEYYSTHCRHGDHEACAATTINGGVRKPAECKLCGAPCRCTECDHDVCRCVTTVPTLTPTT